MRAEGIRGESLAEGYLKSKGYKIIGRNENYGDRVDLIATAPDGDVCFIEVKSRTTYSYGYALEAVTPAKSQGTKIYQSLHTDSSSLRQDASHRRYRNFGRRRRTYRKRRRLKPKKVI